MFEVFMGTPLYRVSMFGDIDVMRWPPNHGADVNARQNDGWTPLHLVAVNGQPVAVQLLLDSKADTNSRNEAGNLPLYEAFFYVVDFSEAIGVVRRLLEHGATQIRMMTTTRTQLRYIVHRTEDRSRSLACYSVTAPMYMRRTRRGGPHCKWPR